MVSQLITHSMLQTGKFVDISKNVRFVASEFDTYAQPDLAELVRIIQEHEKDKLRLVDTPFYLLYFEPCFMQKRSKTKKGIQMANALTLVFFRQQKCNQGG